MASAVSNLGGDANAKKVVAAVAAITAACGLVAVLYKKGVLAKAKIGYSHTIMALKSKLGRGGSPSSKGPIRHVSGIVKRGYTKEELAKYNGENNERIFMSVKMKVYEVAPHFYGPGEHYHVFAGAEASRALAKSDLSGKYLNQYWVNCTEEELEELEHYVEKFTSKYPVVGWFVADDEFYNVKE